MISYFEDNYISPASHLSQLKVLKQNLHRREMV